MKESLKYDPLHTFLISDRKNRDVDNIIFLKVMDNLQIKIDDLTKQLIAEEDEKEIRMIKVKLENMIKDKEDAQRNLEINLKKANEVPILKDWEDTEAHFNVQQENSKRRHTRS